MNQLVYIPTHDATEAKAIGRALVEERLASCVNVLPSMESIYWWKGQIEESSEALLLVKTTSDQLDAITARVKELHSYECPVILALPATALNDEDHDLPS